MKLKTRLISPESEMSFERKFAIAKEQTEKYCPEELAKKLEAEGYMIDKPYPYDDNPLDIEKAIEEDEADGNAPHEWIQKCFQSCMYKFSSMIIALRLHKSHNAMNGIGVIYLILWFF